MCQLDIRHKPECVNLTYTSITKGGDNMTILQTAIMSERELINFATDCYITVTRYDCDGENTKLIWYSTTVSMDGDNYHISITDYAHGVIKGTVYDDIDDLISHIKFTRNVNTVSCHKVTIAELLTAIKTDMST